MLIGVEVVHRDDDWSTISYYLTMNNSVMGTQITTSVNNFNTIKHSTRPVDSLDKTGIDSSPDPF